MVEAMAREILRRLKDEGLMVEAMAKEILLRLKDEGLMVETVSKEILQRLKVKEEEPIRELTVMQ